MFTSGLPCFRSVVQAFVLALMLLVNGCTESGERLKAKPNAFGELASLVVIADPEVWEGPIGDTIRNYYSSAYLILPQPEPILDLKFYSSLDLLKAPLRRELKSYLFLADMSDKQSPTAALVRKELGPRQLDQFQSDPQKNNLVVGYDRWAKGQLILFQLADSRENLIKHLKDNLPDALRKIRAQDAIRLEANAYQAGRNTKLEAEIEARMHVRLKVPRDYVVAVDDGKAYWLRRETDKASFSLLISRFPYTDVRQFSRDNVIHLRDSLGKKYVSSRAPNSYMVVNDKDLPVFGQVTRLNGKYAYEGRGIWELENDYMAGSFITYLVHHPKRGEIIFLDAFLYAPGETKRDKMLHLEHILRTASIP